MPNIRSEWNCRAQIRCCDHFDFSYEFFRNCKLEPCGSRFSRKFGSSHGRAFVSMPVWMDSQISYDWIGKCSYVRRPNKQAVLPVAPLKPSRFHQHPFQHRTTINISQLYSNQDISSSATDYSSLSQPSWARSLFNARQNISIKTLSAESLVPNSEQHGYYDHALLNTNVTCMLHRRKAPSNDSSRQSNMGSVGYKSNVLLFPTLFFGISLL